MPVSNTYRALIFTTLLSSTVVFLGFTIHIKKKSELAAETFYKLEAESIAEEKKEDLKDILKSLDNLLSTNKAYNENKSYNSADDTEFNEQLEAIKNRTTIEDIKEIQNALSVSERKSNPNRSEAFKDINTIINKRSENQKSQSSNNNANKNSSVSYSLVDRTHTFLPTPVYLCQQAGKIVINITVDHIGNVTNATYNNASSSTNGCLIDHALEYAKAAKFNEDASKASQIGTITFYFKGKH